MNCPHCHQPIDTAAIPDGDLKSERARRNQARRLTRAGGKPLPPHPYRKGCRCKTCATRRPH